MKNVLKRSGGKSSNSARVVDGKLILSFPEAQTPVVWQMDLMQAKASALEVREDKKSGGFTLTLKTPKGETVDVASFAQRENAVEGLMAAAHALENAQGQIRPANTAGHEGGTVTAFPQKKPGSKRLVGVVLALFLLVALMGIWGSLAPRPPTSFQPASNDSNSAAPANNGADAAGVPISADDFLNQQQ